MRHIKHFYRICFMLAAFGLLAGLNPAVAHARSNASYHYYQYLDGTKWAYTNGAFHETTLSDPCSFPFGNRMNAQALTVQYATVAQEFTTSPEPGAHWSIVFDIATPSLAGASWWDQIRVQVQDLNTGQIEFLDVNGTQLTSTCHRVYFPLTRDYAGHRIRVSLNAQPFTTLDMYIENAALFAEFYN